jgi:hypothetical protein
MEAVVGCLPSKCEALSSNPSTAKKKKKETEMIQGIWIPITSEKLGRVTRLLNPGGGGDKGEGSKCPKLE